MVTSAGESTNMVSEIIVFLTMEDKLYLRRRIQDYCSEKKKPKTIAKLLKCKIGRVYYWKRRFVNEEGYHDRSRSGAPKK